MVLMYDPMTRAIQNWSVKTIVLWFFSKTCIIGFYRITGSITALFWYTQNNLHSENSQSNTVYTSHNQFPSQIFKSSKNHICSHMLQKISFIRKRYKTEVIESLPRPKQWYHAIESSRCRWRSPGGSGTNFEPSIVLLQKVNFSPELQFC